MKQTKSFLLGCLITAFVVSLSVNYLFYAGVFTHAILPPMTDDDKLRAIYRGL